MATARAVRHAAVHAAAKAVRFAAPAANAVLGGLARRRRIGAPLTRARFLRRLRDVDVLEIGPFYSPSLEGPRVSYFDIDSTAGLTARARAEGLPFATIPRIDFHSPDGDLGGIARTFEAVLSCHVIEHQPDLVRHLRQVRRLLRPGGGYFLTVPDKRRCFDHYRPLSVAADVVAAHDEGRRVHRPESVLGHRLETTHNVAALHWLGVHGRPHPSATDRRAAIAEAARAAAGEYCDVHAWHFSPRSFRDLIEELREAGLIDLSVAEISTTGFGDLEFHAVLR